MADNDDEVEMTDAPATWENIADGEEKKLIGEITRNKSLVEEGEEEIEIAHEVRDEWREQEQQRHEDNH